MGTQSLWTNGAGRTDEDLLVAVILDRSGSMGAVRDDTIGAFNGFVSDLRAQDGRTILTLTQFDSESVDIVHDGVNIASVPPLTHRTFIPRGMTPLLDAIGRTLAATEARAVGWAGSVLVAIITDGHENASHEWTRAKIFACIDALKARGWGFMYLGAGPDSFAEAHAIGVPAGSTAVWQPTAAGVKAWGMGMGKSAQAFRTKRAMADALIAEEDRRAMREE